MFLSYENYYNKIRYYIIIMFSNKIRKRKIIENNVIFQINEELISIERSFLPFLAPNSTNIPGSAIDQNIFLYVYLSCPP
jgi:hypothetical protein